jgi:predicted  nucleic acid-binding Zn-ribbon protein
MMVTAVPLAGCARNRQMTVSDAATGDPANLTFTQRGTNALNKTGEAVASAGKAVGKAVTNSVDWVAHGGSQTHKISLDNPEAQVAAAEDAAGEDEVVVVGATDRASSSRKRRSTVEDDVDTADVRVDGDIQTNLPELDVDGMVSKAEGDSTSSSSSSSSRRRSR